MGRRPIGTKAMTGAEKVAAHAARLKARGGRRVTVTLSADEAAAVDRIKAQIGVASDAEALAYVLHLVRRDAGF